MSEGLSRRRNWLCGVALATVCSLMGNAAADGREAVHDNTCLLCHGLISKPTTPAARARILDGSPTRLAVMTPQGPTLNGIVGRPVAIMPKYAYSKAMRKFASTGAVWDRATLDQFLTDSRAMVKGFMVVELKEEERRRVLDNLERIATYDGKSVASLAPPRGDEARMETLQAASRSASSRLARFMPSSLSPSFQ